MLRARHETTVPQAMQQGVDAAQLIQFAEFFFDDLLDVFPAKRTNFVVFARAGVEPRTQPFFFFP